MSEPVLLASYCEVEANEFDWEDTCGTLTQWMEEHSEYHGMWEVTVSNFGWRSLSGHAEIKAFTGADLLRGCLPDTANSFTVHSLGATLSINNSHHDKPCGGELYRVKALGECEYCGDFTMELQAVGGLGKMCSECADDMLDDQDQREQATGDCAR
jgi:hypothetical protein